MQSRCGGCVDSYAFPSWLTLLVFVGQQTNVLTWKHQEPAKPGQEPHGSCKSLVILAAWLPVLAHEEEAWGEFCPEVSKLPVIALCRGGVAGKDFPMSTHASAICLAASVRQHIGVHVGQERWLCLLPLPFARPAAFVQGIKPISSL